MKKIIRYSSLLLFSLLFAFLILNKYENYLDNEINNYTINKEIVSMYSFK